MRLNRTVTASAAAAIAVCAASAILYYFYNGRLLDDAARYMDSIYRIERAVIEHVPIHEDFTSPQKEAELRRYLLPAHLDAVKRAGLAELRQDSDIAAQKDSGALRELASGGDALYYFYNVRKELRLLAPFAAEGLARITGRFQQNLKKRTTLPPVKIAISSALRPLSYQHGLRGRNPNATLESSHCFGASFDIFYDEYFVRLPVDERACSLSRRAQETSNRRLGFLMGAALRRQFHAALMETLLELQDEGVLYAILEKHQRCYHVTILKK